MSRSRGWTRTSRGESTATSRSIVRPPVAAASGAPEARADPSARVIGPPRCGVVRRSGVDRLGPVDPGGPRADHRVMGADVAVKVLVRPAEALRVQPLLVAHPV